MLTFALIHCFYANENVAEYSMYDLTGCRNAPLLTLLSFNEHRNKYQNSAPMRGGGGIH